MRMNNQAVLGLIGVIAGIVGVVVNVYIANWPAVVWALGNSGWALAYYAHHKNYHSNN